MKEKIYHWITPCVIIISFILCFIIFNNSGMFILFNLLILLSIVIIDQIKYRELQQEILLDTYNYNMDWIREDYDNLLIKVKEAIDIEEDKIRASHKIVQNNIKKELNKVAGADNITKQYSLVKDNIIVDLELLLDKLYQFDSDILNLTDKRKSKHSDISKRALELLNDTLSRSFDDINLANSDSTRRVFLFLGILYSIDTIAISKIGSQHLLNVSNSFYSIMNCLF